MFEMIHLPSPFICIVTIYSFQFKLQLVHRYMYTLHNLLHTWLMCILTIFNKENMLGYGININK